MNQDSNLGKRKYEDEVVTLQQVQMSNDRFESKKFHSRNILRYDLRSF